MVQNVARTKVVIDADNRASRVIDNVKRDLIGLSSVGSRLSGLVSPLGAISAGVAALGVGTLAVKNFVNSIDDLAATAAGLGVTAVQLAEMRSKAAESAVGVDQLDGALAKLNERLADAKEGNKEAIAAFARFGIDPRKVTDTEHAMRLIADRVRELGNTAERGAALGDLLGQRYGPRLAGYLSGGAEGLRQFTGLTEESVRESLKLQTELNKLSNSFERLKNTVLGAVVPAINSFIEALEGGSIQARIAGLTADINRLAKQTPGRRQPSGRTALEELRDLVEQRAKLIDKLEEQDTRFEQAPKPLPKPKEPTKAGRDPAAQFLENLQKQAIAANYTAEQVLRIEAAQLGVTAAAEPWIQSLLAGKEAAEALRQAQEELRELAADEARERQALTDLQRRQYDEELAALDRVRELNGDITREQQRRFDALQRLLDSGVIDEEQFGAGILDALPVLDRYNDKIKETKSLAEELGLTFSSAFEDAIVSGNSLRDVLRGLEQDILRIVTRELVTKPVASLITDLVKSNTGGGDFFGKLFGSLFGTRAMGGPVTGGYPYLVGERGPELFVPRGSGHVVDADNTKRFGRSMTVNNYITVAGNTSAASAQQIGAAAARALAIADARFN